MSKKLCSVDQFGKPAEHRDFLSFYQSLPDFLGANQLKALAKRIAGGGTVVAAIGGHVIKVGAGPYLIDMIKKGQITRVVMNGAAAIHDVEIALMGKTSEDVEAGVKDGTFGTNPRTIEFFRHIAHECDPDLYSKREYGECIQGWLACQSDGKNRKNSVLVACYEHCINVHVILAIGTDTIFLHDINPEHLAAASCLDAKAVYKLFCDTDKLTWLNIGSAVILPEVFLKAYQYAKIKGKEPKDLHKANLDMIKGQYRPTNNVLARVPGTNYDLTGHHEIMLPLLHAAVQVEANILKSGYATTVAL